MKKIAAISFSLLFHPLIFAIITPFVIIYHSTSDMFYAMKWTGFSLLFVFCAMVALYLIRPKDFFKDFDISKREKRPLFYTISLFFAVLYFSIAVFLKSILFPMSLVALGITIGLVVFEIANNYIKVSVHAAVACAFIITFGLLYGVKAFLFIFWIPLAVGWARLVLKRHTREEVISGAMVGTTITLITFAIAELLV